MEPPSPLCEDSSSSSLSWWLPGGHFPRIIPPHYSLSPYSSLTLHPGSAPLPAADDFCPRQVGIHREQHWKARNGIRPCGKGGTGSEDRLSHPLPALIPCPLSLSSVFPASRGGMGGLGLWLGCGAAGAAPPNLAKGFVDPVWDPARSLVASREWEFGRTSGTGLAGHKVVLIPLTQ